MRGEDFQADVRQERHDDERREQQRVDAISDARHDLVTEARTLRRHTQYTLDWFRSLGELTAITDRLNELEGATS